jgi:hypothetical protein
MLMHLELDTTEKLKYLNSFASIFFLLRGRAHHADTDTVTWRDDMNEVFVDGTILFSYLF